MFYSELNKVLLKEKTGFLVNLKYDRFAQVNFQDDDTSLLIVADFKDFEIATNKDNIRITVKEEAHISSFDVNVHDLNHEEHVLFNTSKGNVIVISKELSDKVHIDGLMILSNPNSIMDLITYFSVEDDIVIKIPFPETEFDYLTTFINKVGRKVTGVELDTIMETDDNGNMVSKPGIIISVKYNLARELELFKKYSKSDNKAKDICVQKLKEMKNPDRIISDKELTDLLDDYSEMSNDSKFWFVETEYTEEDYMREYSRLCNDVRRDFHKDGKIEFIYDPSIRNAITDKNCELR